MSDFIPNRVSAGKSTGGQFAEKVNSESSIDLPSDENVGDDSYTNVEAALTKDAKPVTLTFVDYDDTLTDEQVKKGLRGDWDTVEQEVNDHFSEYEYEPAREIAEQEINYLNSEGKFHAEWDDLDDDEKHDAVIAVQGRNDAHPMKDLLRNTPMKPLTSRVGTISARDVPNSEILEPDWDGEHTEERMQIISSILTKKGMDTSNPETQEALRELVTDANGDWNGAQIDVAWESTIEDASPRGYYGAGQEAEEATGRKLQFTNPVISINQDSYNGGTVTIPGTLDHSVTTSSPAEIDDAASFNYVSGNSKPTYVSTTGWLK